MEELFEGVWRKNEKLYTENLVPGNRVYGEELVDFEEIELRRWDPHRSKLGAAISKGLPELALDRNSTVLYLGAASGTTPSHLSDICSEGIIFGVEHSPRVVRDLLKLSEDRKNLAPVYADARKPEDFSDLVGKVDLVFQDIAQPDQIPILKRNCKRFLKPDGEALIALKLRSISSSRDLQEIIDDSEAELKQGFDIRWSSDLEPYEKDHMFYRLEL